MNRLYIFCGIPFSGKSFIARKVAKQFNYKVVDLDEVKFELFGKDIVDENIDQQGWDKIYLKMYRKIEELLKNGYTVIHDTGNFTKYERDLVKKIADKLNLETITVFINIPIEVAKNRLLENRRTCERFDVADEAFASCVKEMEPPGDNEKHIVFKPKDDLEIWISKYFR